MKQKRISALLLSAAISLSLLPVNTAFAAQAEALTVTIDTGSVTLQDTDGDGYYEIGTADELYAFSAVISDGSYNHNGQYCGINGKLTENITVNESVPDFDGTYEGDTTALRSWTPIGGMELAYTGIFDGNGKIISGLYCDVQGSDGDWLYIGLFGCVSADNAGSTTAAVKSVTVKDSYFRSESANGYIGAVVGYGDGCIITGCKNENSSIICDGNTGNSLGGVVGGSVGSTFENCSNTGFISLNVSSAENNDSYVGGVVGRVVGGTVKNCRNDGEKILSAVKQAQYSSSIAVGGVVGEGYTDENYAPVEVINCSNTAALSAEAMQTCIGGIIGVVTIPGENDVTIKKCSNAGSVSAKMSSTAYQRPEAYAGGIVGKNSLNASSGSSVAVTIEGCSNTGSVDVDTNGVPSPFVYIGGVVGQSEGDRAVAAVENCYYLGEEETDELEGTTVMYDWEFNEGRVTYLLNGSCSDGVWKQTIDIDETPKFIGMTVYYKDYNYYNENNFEILGIGDDKKSAVVALKQPGVYQLVFADYEKGKLANVKIVPVEIGLPQNFYVESEADFTLGTGDKVMLWNSLSDL